MSKPFELELRLLEQREYRAGKMCWVTFLWPWLKVMVVAFKQKFDSLHNKVRTTNLITTYVDGYILYV